MVNRVQPGSLRRELRFSRTAIEQNLSSLSLDMNSIKPLLEACMTNTGLLGLYGSELLLLEKALGFHQGLSAVSLVGELVSVKKLPANTGISYGYLSSTSSVTNVGLVALGFSDGVPRQATNRIRLGINGNWYTQIGRIAMDQCVIDLQDANPELGSEVFFFDEENSLADFAKSLCLTPLELLGRITNRVTRTWTK